VELNILFIVSAIIAEAVGTFTGFGAVTILLPIATFFMPVKEAVVSIALFHLFGTSFRTLFFARKINLKVALVFGIPSLIFSAIGATFLSNFDTNTLTKIVGGALILYAFYSLLKEKIKLPKSNFILASGGSVVGFLAGLVGTAGAMRGAFLTAWNLAPEVYLGTGALMGLGADAARVAVYYKGGMLSFLGNQTVIILLVIALIGTTIGKILVVRTKEKIFTKFIFIALTLAGARLLFL